MLGDAVGLDHNIVPIGHNGSAHQRSQGDRRGSPRRRGTSAVAYHGADVAQTAEQAAGQHDDNDDKSHAHDQFPHEGQAARELGAGDFDHQGAHHRADQGSTPAERHHDHELGTEYEAGIFGGGDTAEADIAETGQRRDNACDDIRAMRTSEVSIPR